MEKLYHSELIMSWSVLMTSNSTRKPSLCVIAAILVAITIRPLPLDISFGAIGQTTAFRLSLAFLVNPPRQRERTAVQMNLSVSAEDPTFYWKQKTTMTYRTHILTSFLKLKVSAYIKNTAFSDFAKMKTYFYNFHWEFAVKLTYNFKYLDWKYPICYKNF